MIGLRRAKPGVLAFVDLVQDIDVMLPILDALKAHGGFRLKICVSRWLAKESPRVGALLDAHRLPFAYVPRRRIVEGAAPSLRGLSAVLSAAESSHPAHTAAHALARRAVMFQFHHRDIRWYPAIACQQRRRAGTETDVIFQEGGVAFTAGDKHFPGQAMR